MKIKANSPQEYIAQLPEDRQQVMQKLQQVILDNIPDGFVHEMNYGMIGFVVPKSIYPAGYHCTPELPLPFVNIASQKNFIALYHLGIYSSPELLKWFQSEYPKYVKTKLDMGKSCIRFKNLKNIPFELIGELMQKMTVNDWITLYEENYKKK